MASDPLVIVLRQIARVVAGTLELREVFAYVAEVAASVVPFDSMSVVRYRADGTLERYSFTGQEGKKQDAHATVRLDDFSPAIRPSPVRCGASTTSTPCWTRASPWIASSSKAACAPASWCRWC